MTRTLGTLLLWSLTILGAASPLAAQEIPKDEEKPIHGIVVDQAGNPVAGAEVRTWGAKSVAAFMYETVVVSTNEKGEFKFEPGTTMASNGSKLILAATDGGRLQSSANPIDIGDDANPPIRLTLEPSEAVEVRVTDRRGAPVADAELSSTDSLRLHGAPRTDQDGNATMYFAPSAPTLGSRQIIAYKAGIGFDYYDFSRSTPPLPIDAVDLPRSARLVLGGTRTVFVTVRTDDGTPIPNIKVSALNLQSTRNLTPMRLWFEGRFLRQSDENGIATFEWCPKTWSGVARFSVSDSLYFPARAAEAIAPTDDEPLELDLYVNLPAHIQGRVFDSQGKALRGASIHTELHHTTTNDEGVYDVTVASRRRMKIVAVHPDGTAVPKDIDELGEGQTKRDVDFHLVRGTTVEATVVDDETAKPVSSATIAVIDRNATPKPTNIFGKYWPAMSVTQFADRDGKLALRLPEGEYSTRAHGLSGSVLKGCELDVSAVGDVMKVTYRVKPERIPEGVERRIVRGKVLIENGGSIVGDLTVSGIEQGTSAPGIRGMTDDQGRFALYALQKPTLLYVRTNDGLTAALLGIGSEPISDVELVMGRTASLSTSVHDGAGNTVANREVECSMYALLANGDVHEVPWTWRSRTDENGEHLVNGIPIGARLTVSLPGVIDPAATQSVDVLESRKYTTPTLIDVPPSP